MVTVLPGAPSYGGNSGVCQERQTVPPPIKEESASALASEEPAKPASADSNDSYRYMLLQAASFREPGDAQQLQHSLRDFGLLAQVSKVKASDGET